MYSCTHKVLNACSLESEKYSIMENLDFFLYIHYITCSVLFKITHVKLKIIKSDEDGC